MDSIFSNAPDFEAFNNAWNAGLNENLSSINSSSPTSVSPFSNPVNFNNMPDMTKVMGSASPAASAGGSSTDPSKASWSDILLNPVTGFKWLMDQGNRVSAGINNTVRDLPNFSTPFGQQIQNNVNDFLQGYQNPDQALSGRQVFDKMFLGGHDVPYLSGVGAFANDMATNPLSYIPVPIGKIAQVTGITPALKAGLDYLKSTPVLDNKVVNSVTDFLGNKFVKNYGASPDLINILNSRDAEHGANQFNVIQSLKDLGSNHGLNDAELNNIGHIVEKTQTGNPAQMAFINKWEQLRDNGVPNSNSTGTNALSNTTLNNKPLLGNQLPDYFKHMYRNVPDDLKGVFPKSGFGVPGLSPSGEFNLPRTFNTLQDAINAGLKPETNPLLVLGEHLNQSSKAITNAKALNDIQNTPGLLFDKNAIDDAAKLVKTGQITADQAAQRLGMNLDELKKGFIESSIPQLRGAYIRPADEAALKSFLEPVQKNSLYDKGLGLWKQATTMNSLVHGHNIAYNGLWLGGAKPSYVVDALKNGPNDQWFQRALGAGAISADRGGFTNNLKNAIVQPKGMAGQVWDKLKYAYHGALWDTDRALRTAIFRDAVEKGATDAEAAAKANKFLINYNNLTPFEEKVMTRIFPFYSWMKGNLPLQVEQWINNTPKQMLYEQMKNATNQAISGQNMGSDGKIDTGIVLGDGSHIKIDPYSPADEPLKLLNDGALPFLYSKVNPIVKELADQLSNKAYYPGSPLAPNGKESMANTAIRINGAPEGYNIAKTLTHSLNNSLPESGVLGGLAGGGISALTGSPDASAAGTLNGMFGLPQQNKTPMTVVEALTKALGGFSSRDNPLKDQYFQQKDQQSQKQGYLNYLRQTGQPVSKQMTKDAYKKEKMPVGN